MKPFLKFIFLVIYNSAICSSENVSEVKVEGVDSNDFEIIPGNIGDILLDKKFDYPINRGQGLFEGRSYKFAFDEGNPDVHGKIHRPCQSYDTFCIRKFFAEHSQCQVSGRLVPEPLYRDQTTLNLPNANISVSLVNAEYSGIRNGRIAEFYIDKTTENLVISVTFDQITLTVPNVNIKFYLRGREPIVTRDSSSGAFVQVSVTAVIPNLKNLTLDRAEIFTFSPASVAPIIIGPQLALSTDPEVLTMYAEVLANLPTDTMELLFTDGVFYILNFIQYNICDFGLKAK